MWTGLRVEHASASNDMLSQVTMKESASAAEYLSVTASSGNTLVASMLLYTELHCAGAATASPASS